jgi:hypothetical protein
MNFAAHLTEHHLRDVELEAERMGIDAYATDYAVEHVPHPRQLSIFDALSADELRAYLARAL